MRRRQCKDVEYMVHGWWTQPGAKIGRTGRVGADGNAYFRNQNDALLTAVDRALNGDPTKVDVLIHSERGARCYAGESGVEAYREDPEASAFDSWEVKVTPRGRVR